MSWLAALPIAGSIISGLFGDKASKRQAAVQQQAVDVQKAAVKPMQEMFRNIGQPGYISAIKGLMSSFGFRPASGGVAGTSMGQPLKTKLTPAELNLFKTFPAGPVPKGSDFYKLLGEIGAGATNRGIDFTGTSMGNPIIPHGLMNYPISSIVANLRRRVKEKGMLKSNDQNAIDFTGTWGNYADVNRQMGVTTDQYAKAEQDIMNRTDLDSRTKMALLARIRMQKQSDMQTQIENAARAGPLALLQALAPALAAGTAGITGAEGIAGSLQNMATTVGQQGQASQAGLIGALQVLGNVFGQKQAKVPPQIDPGFVGATSGIITPGQSPTTVAAPTSGWINPYQRTIESGMLNPAQKQAAINWGFGG